MRKLGACISALAVVLTCVAGTTTAYADEETESSFTEQSATSNESIGLSAVYVNDVPVSINYESVATDTDSDGVPVYTVYGDVETDLSNCDLSSIEIIASDPEAEVDMISYDNSIVEALISSSDGTKSRYKIHLIEPYVRIGIGIDGQDYEDVAGETFYMNVGDSWTSWVDNGIQYGGFTISVESAFVDWNKFVGFDSSLIELVADGGGSAGASGLYRWYSKLTAVSNGTVVLGYVDEEHNVNGTITIVIGEDGDNDNADVAGDKTDSTAGEGSTVDNGVANTGSSNGTGSTSSEETGGANNNGSASDDINSDDSDVAVSDAETESDSEDLAQTGSAIILPIVAFVLLAICGCFLVYKRHRVAR